MPQNMRGAALLNIHATLARSRANGPGVRYVVWFQGCSLGCQGCFNPATHHNSPTRLIAPGELVAEISGHLPHIDGVTVSGGEPTDQAEGLLEFLVLLRLQTPLSVVLFSGRTVEEIRALVQGEEILRHVDALIDGRYDHALHCGTGLRGNSSRPSF